MIKGYSGVFRLGEATSTLDADSAVCQYILVMFNFSEPENLYTFALIARSHHQRYTDSNHQSQFILIIQSKKFFQ